MSEFQQGMILRNVCNDTHCIYIQDIPSVGYGKNCIVYNLKLNRYIVTDDKLYRHIEDDCPIVNVFHTQSLMIESYKAYIRNASEGSLFIAEQVLKHFKQLQGSDLLLTDNSVFSVKDISLLDGVLTTDWTRRIQFDGVRRSPDGHKRVQIATLRDLRPNNVLFDALCKSIQESDK
jgi:hypothetical protein|nr:MAG TPA: hypothetical protein [Caudoviricetes sp.]